MARSTVEYLSKDQEIDLGNLLNKMTSMCAEFGDEGPGQVADMIDGALAVIQDGGRTGHVVELNGDFAGLGVQRDGSTLQDCEHEPF